MACWRTRKKGSERKVPADGGRELEEELLGGLKICMRILEKS